MPGLITIASSSCHGQSHQLVKVIWGISCWVFTSSKAKTCAPAASRAATAARPDLPRPGPQSSALSYYVELAFGGLSSAISMRKGRRLQHHRNDPKTDNNGWLRPPFFLKMMMEGAIRKIRLPVNLNDATCKITDRVSTTNNPPVMASTSSWRVATEIAPNVPPRASDPVSPIKTRAGGALNHKNPSPAPISAPHITARSPVPGT